MDGKWGKWWVIPLFLLSLPGMLWQRIRRRSKAPSASRWDDMPVTPEEEEEWQRMERK